MTFVKKTLMIHNIGYEKTIGLFYQNLDSYVIEEENNLRNKDKQRLRIALPTHQEKKKSE